MIVYKSPGIITGTRISRPAPDFPASFLAQAITTTPLGRNGIPLDVAKGIVFLASPLAEWIDSQNIYIEGGYYGP